MSLIHNQGSRLMRTTFFVLTVIAIMSLVVGCGPSAETTSEAGMEEDADQQALTSFIGAKPTGDTPTPEPVVEEEIPVANIGEEMEQLRTENTSLKQKLLKLEQDNRSLTAQLNDADAKLMAEKSRADSAAAAARLAMETEPLVRSREARPLMEGEMAAYEDALQTFNARQYDLAIDKLQGILDAGVSDKLADNCHYWIGESNFAKRQFSQAIQSFEKVFEYRDSEKKGDARYMTARSFERLGNKERAKAEYERVVSDFPTSRLVEKARERAARL